MEDVTDDQREPLTKVSTYVHGIRMTSWPISKSSLHTGQSLNGLSATAQPSLDGKRPPSTYLESSP